jgi:hypothetical protein
MRHQFSTLISFVAVIVSFTTSPTRLHKCCPVIDSLLNQTRRPDATLPNLPPRFDRTGEEYPPDESLPRWLIGNSLVKIERCDRDWGPVKKILPTVLRLQQQSPCSVVISVDDAIRYPAGAVSALAEAAIPCAVGNTEHETWCAAGFDIVNARPRSVTEPGQLCAVAEGFAGQCGVQWVLPIYLLPLPQEGPPATGRINSPDARTGVHDAIGVGGNIWARHPGTALYAFQHVVHPGCSAYKAVGFEVQEESVPLPPTIVDREVDPGTVMMVVSGVMIFPEPEIARHRISDDDRVRMRV